MHPRWLLLLGLLLPTVVCAGETADASDNEQVATPTEEELRWFDKANALLSGSAKRSALWFDGFFGPNEETDQAEGFLRIRTQQRFIERKSNKLKLRVSASYYLPNTQRQLKLLIESDEDEISGSAPSGDEGAGDGTTQAALRWTPLDYKSWDLSFDVGLRFDSGLDPFVRTRARHYYALDKRTVLKLSQELRLEVQDGWSETSRAVLERVYQDVAYRAEIRGRYGEETDGMEWLLGLARADKLNKQTALASFIRVSGATDDDDEQSEIWRLGVNLRRNFLREWLFFEVEPQITWPREFGYDSNGELKLLLEAQFGVKR